MGKQIQTDDPRFVRDIESRALLNTDHNALQQHRQERVYFENQRRDINIMKDQIKHLTLCLNGLQKHLGLILYVKIHH